MTDYAWDDQSIEDRLVSSSTDFARSAVAAYCGESWDVFYLHLATALEQLLKAVLAKIHPSLIADSREFDSLLHLCGLGHKAKTPEFARAVRTITATEALTRVARVLDDHRQPAPRVRLLLDTRNAIVHSGHREKGEAEAVLGDTAQYMIQLLADLELGHQEYWGDSAEMVAEHTERRLSEREASYHRRVQVARERFNGLVADMEDATFKAFLAATSPSAPGASFDTAVAECPACGHDGELTGFPDPEWTPDWDVSDGQAWSPGAYVSAIVLQGDGFHCRVCNLELGPLDLPFADMEYVTLSEDDFDVTQATAFFEREFFDEDEWIS